MPIDIYLRQASKDELLDAYVTLPFLTTLSPTTHDSDIQGPLDLSRMVLNLYRRAAYKDSNLSDIAEEMRRLTENPALPPYANIFLSAVAFLLSDRYINF